MPRPRTSKPLSPDHAALGDAIAAVIAENAHLTPDSVSRRSGLSNEQIGRLIRGVSNPTYTTLLRLCHGLGVTLGTLLARAEDLKNERGQR